MKIGDEVSIPFGPLHAFKHKGVYIGNSHMTGEPVIAHNSKKHRCVSKHSLTEFSEGKPVSVRTRPTKRNEMEIIAESEKRMGNPYSALKSNCEDFVSDVLGLNEGSPQRVAWGVIGAIGLLAFLTRSRAA